MLKRNVYQLRDDPHPDESVQSFMHRLKTINGFPVHGWITSDVGLISADYRLTMENVERLAYFSRTPVATIASMTALAAGERQVSVGGLVLPIYSVIQMCSRVCCTCLAKDGYHRLVWNMPAVAACPFCGSALTEVCPTCGDRLTWKRNELLECRAKGHVLDVALPLAAEELPDRLMLSRIIYEKLGHEPQWPSEAAKLAPALREANLSDYLDLLGFLDLFRTGGEASTENVDYRLWDSVRMTENWPTNFHDALRLHREQKPKGHKAVLFAAKIMRQINTRRQNAPGRSFEFFKDAADAFVIENNIPIHSRSSFADYGERSVSINVASSKLKVKPATFVTIASRLGVPLIDPGDGLTLRIKNSDLERLLNEKRPEIVTAPQISKRLGIHATWPEEMIKRGLFGSEAIDRPSDVKRIKWFITADEFRTFQHRVQERLNAAKPIPESRRWTGFQIKYHPTSIDFIDVLAGFLVGDIRISAGEFSHLGKIRFYDEDMVRLMHSKHRCDSAAAQGEVAA